VAVANREPVVGVVSYGDKHALARLQYENCSPPKASVDTTGTQTLTICTKTVGVPAKPEQLAHHRCLYELPPTHLTGVNVPEPRCWASSIASLKRSVSWQDTGTPCTQSLHSPLAYCRDSQPIYCGRKHQPSCQRKTWTPCSGNT